MTFFDSAKRLGKEVLLLRKYKSMPLPLAIITAVAVCPFILLFILFLGLSVLLSILLSFMETPIHYLHDIVRKEGAELRHATQFIVYFISWPAIFLLYFLQAFATFFIAVTYFVAVLFGYVGSLGGIKFHISMLEENLEVEEREEYFFVLPIILDAIALSLISTIIVLAIVYTNLLALFILVYIAFVSIYVPIAFRHSEPKPAPKPVEEAKVEEPEPEPEPEAKEEAKPEEEPAPEEKAE